MTLAGAMKKMSSLIGFELSHKPADHVVLW